MIWNQLFILLGVFILNSISISLSYRCQSCFAGCHTIEDCDCDDRDQENATCDGAYCYAKLEHFNDDDAEGVSAIQKGCTNEISVSFLGCQYASDDRSIACFCAGNFCNSAMNLSRYQTPQLPTVTCCECNDDESGHEICYPQNCTRNCTGNYCYLDLVANAQGCGWGHPQIFHFLRSKDYRRFSNQLTCAEYYDNYRNYMSGCTCSENFCNVIHDSGELERRKRIHSEQRKQHFCYSLYANSETSFELNIYQQASQCPSYFCFISWTSVEVIFDPDDEDGDVFGLQTAIRSKRSENRNNDQNSDKWTLPALRSAYEVSAGCLLVDDEEKVQVGCTVEWSQNENAPLTKHCICNEKLCNDFSMINEIRPPPSISTPLNDETKRPPFRPGSLSSAGTTRRYRLNYTQTSRRTVTATPKMILNSSIEPNMISDQALFIRNRTENESHIVFSRSSASKITNYKVSILYIYASIMYINVLFCAFYSTV